MRYACQSKNIAPPILCKQSQQVGAGGGQGGVSIFNFQSSTPMTTRFSQSEDYRRDELIRIIEQSVEKLTLPELEALYYDMTTKSYIND